MRDAWLITRVDRLAEGDVTVVLEALKFIKVIDRYEHRCRLPVLGQHNTFMAAPGTVDQFGEMMAGLGNRTRERHSSTVQLVADSRPHGTPTRHAGSMAGGVRSGGARRASRWYADPGLAGGQDAFDAAVAAMPDDARGWRLAEISKRRGMTQEQVAARMGVSVARVSQIESGDVSTQDVLSRFVAALGGTLKLVADFGDEQLKLA